jgi:hypothetical protein
MERKIISISAPSDSGTSSFPIFARFFFEERNLLSYKDGAVPFFIGVDSASDDPSIAEVKSSLTAGRRVPKGYIFDKFSVYEIDDYSVQSLSPGFEDFTAMVFNSSGQKIAQKDVVTIKNFTIKKAFIIIPEAVLASGPVTVLLLPRRRTVASEVKQQLTQSGSNFTANLQDLKADSLEDLAIFAREGSTDFEITNSTDFVSLSRSYAETNTLVAEQAGYFKKLQAGEAQSKTTLDSTATISIGITGSSAYAGTKQYGQDHYFGTLDSINSNSSVISSRGIHEVYELLTGSAMKKLIQGKDFWIGSSGSLNISGSTSTKRYEVFLSKDRLRRISSSFDFSTGNLYDLHEALYYAYIKDWNVDKNNSRIRIYKDGLLVKSHDGSGSYEVDTFVAGTYEYIVEDYALASVETPISDTNDVDFHYNDATVQSRTSLAFNKYQISTDPHLTTDGTLISSALDRIEQDAVLYETNEGFRIDAEEPRVTIGYTGSTIASFSINGVTDPLTALLPTVEANYYDFQEEFESSKTKITKAIHDNTMVQSIETQISQLKRNLNSILENSSESFQSYSGSTSAGQFFFLVLKGTSGQTFDIAYRDGSTIVKKEYNCTFDSNGRYISIPFFFDTFGSAESSVSFEVTRGSVSQYRIFR